MIPIRFFGLKAETGKTYSQTVEEAFKVTMATIDPAAKDGQKATLTVSVEGQEHVICTLRCGSTDNQPLDLVFNEGEEVVISVAGDCGIYLSGNFMVLDADLSDMMGMGEHEHEHVHSDSEAESNDEVSSEEDMEGGEMMTEEQLMKLIAAHAKANGNLMPGSSDDSEDDEEGDMEMIDMEEVQDIDSDMLSESDNEEEEIEEKKTNKPQIEAAQPKTQKKAEEKQNNLKRKAAPEPAKKEEKTQDKKQKTAAEKPAAEKKQQPAEKKEQAKKDQQAEKKEKEQPKKQAEKTQEKAQPQKKTLPSGLTIQDVTMGNGPRAKNGKKVFVRYIGKLTNGKVFDSNTKGAPFKFSLGKGEVIKGWDLGIQGMQVGGTRKLTIPAPLAYGKRGAAPDIPPNATLEFEVKLLDVK